MKTIFNKISIIDKMLFSQVVAPEKEYRLLAFCMLKKFDDVYLLFNNLTKQLVVLNEDEYNLLNNPTIKISETTKILIKDWMLVPTDFDDYTFFCQIRDIVKSLHPKQNITSFTILTTTECNARCFYCYEASFKKRTMDKKTMIDTAKFIENNYTGKEIVLRWFGGEPLYNTEAIDTICNYLKEKNIKYRSSMISNGYLFNEENIKKSTDIWKLNSVQITLDGTEEIYNRYKAYIYKDGSAFLRVLNNINNLISSGIKVLIRLNMDKNNVEDLFDLVNQLSIRFPNKQNLNVYVAMLSDYNKDAYFNVKKRKELVDKVIELQDLIQKLGLSTFVSSLSKVFKVNYCMADNDSSVVILPSGKIGKCEHFVQDTDVNVGTVVDGITNYDEIERWKEPREKIEDCEKCLFLPKCLQIKKCPSVDKNSCDECDRFLKEKNLERGLINIYHRFLNNQLDKDDDIQDLLSTDS